MLLREEGGRERSWSFNLRREGEGKGQGERRGGEGKKGREMKVNPHNLRVNMRRLSSHRD